MDAVGAQKYLQVEWNHKACWLQRYWVTLAHLLCFTSPSMQYSVTCLSLGSQWVGAGPPECPSCLDQKPF